MKSFKERISFSSKNRAKKKRKCYVHSTSEPQLHMGLTVYLKLCQDLRSFN